MPFICIVCIGSNRSNPRTIHVEQFPRLGIFWKLFSSTCSIKFSYFEQSSFDFAVLASYFLLNFLNFNINYCPQWQQFCTPSSTVKLRAKNSVGSRVLAGFESRSDGCVNSISVKTYINNFLSRLLNDPVGSLRISRKDGMQWCLALVFWNLKTSSTVTSRKFKSAVPAITFVCSSRLGSYNPLRKRFTDFEWT